MDSAEIIKTLRRRRSASVGWTERSRKMVDTNSEDAIELKFSPGSRHRKVGLEEASISWTPGTTTQKSTHEHDISSPETKHTRLSPRSTRSRKHSSIKVIKIIEKQPSKRLRTTYLSIPPSLFLLILIITTLAIHIPTTSATAVCADTVLYGAYIDLVKLDDPIWDVRKRMCTTGGDCKEEAGVKCVLASEPVGGVYLRGTRTGGVPGGGKDGVGKVPFPGCLNATREIISECFDVKDRIGGTVYLECNYRQETYEFTLLNFTTNPPVEEGKKENLTKVTTTTTTTLITSTTYTTSTTTTDTSTTPAANTSGSNPTETGTPGSGGTAGLSPSTTIGIAVGIPIGIISLAALLFLLYRRHRRRKNRIDHHPLPSASPTNFPPQKQGTYPMEPLYELPQPVPELVTDANAANLGTHLHGGPRAQAPLLMVRAGQVYSPREMGVNEGVGPELPGQRTYEPQEMDGAGYYGGVWKKNAAPE
ncbi:hypothetical protein DFH27DRAFT_251677 [Peziza echinospora]|nr:hypothetical protein DFH27DRAFT_251677 [Peziza echinospora]